MYVLESYDAVCLSRFASGRNLRATVETHALVIWASAKGFLKMPIQDKFTSSKREQGLSTTSPNSHEPHQCGTIMSNTIVSTAKRPNYAKQSARYSVARASEQVCEGSWPPLLPCDSVRNVIGPTQILIRSILMKRSPGRLDGRSLRLTPLIGCVNSANEEGEGIFELCKFSNTERREGSHCTVAFEQLITTP